MGFLDVRHGPHFKVPVHLVEQFGQAYFVSWGCLLDLGLIFFLNREDFAQVDGNIFVL